MVEEQLIEQKIVETEQNMVEAWVDFVVHQSKGPVSDYVRRFIEAYLESLGDASNSLLISQISVDFKDVPEDQKELIGRQLEIFRTEILRLLLARMDALYPSFSDQFLAIDSDCHAFASLLKPNILAFKEDVETLNGLIRNRLRQLFQSAREFNRKRLFSELLPSLYSKDAFDSILDQEMGSASRNQCPIALILFDINRFKSINDIFGHPVGDQVLKKIESIMNFCFRRAGDLKGHDSGDEFAVFLKNLNSSEECRARILYFIQMVDNDPFNVECGGSFFSLRDHFRSEDHLMGLPSVSIGYLWGIPEKNKASQWRSSADKAMAAGKVLGSNESSFHDYDEIKDRWTQIQALIRERDRKRMMG